MDHDYIRYRAGCANGHFTILTFWRTELVEQLTRGTLRLYCASCTAVRVPTAEERRDLLEQVAQLDTPADAPTDTA